MPKYYLDIYKLIDPLVLPSQLLLPEGTLIWEDPFHRIWINCKEKPIDQPEYGIIWIEENNQSGMQN